MADTNSGIRADVVRQVHRERCLVTGCYYGLATQADACVFCGTPRPLPARGRSPVAGLCGAAGSWPTRLPDFEVPLGQLGGEHNALQQLLMQAALNHSTVRLEVEVEAVANCVGNGRPLGEWVALLRPILVHG